MATKNNNSNNYNNRAPGAAGGGGRGRNKNWFQQSASTHSGAEEKESLNINVVGKKTMNKLCNTLDMMKCLE